MTCANCGTTIVFGGPRYKGVRFCSDKCLAEGDQIRAAMDLPDELVAPEVELAFYSECPQCGGPGPVDFLHSYRVISALIVTLSESPGPLRCHRCAQKARMTDLAITTFLGWWGLPWGVIRTPIAITQNLAGLLRRPSDRPGPELDQAVRFDLVANGVVPQGVYPRPPVGRAR